MPDLETQLRDYADWVGGDRPPVDPSALRELAESSPSNYDNQVVAFRPCRQRAPFLAAAAALAAVLVGGAVWAGRPDPAPESTVGGPTTTAPATGAPQLRPDNPNDPLIQCAGRQGVEFRVSALQTPTGAENGNDPASEVLRTALSYQQHRPSGLGSTAMRPTGWRRLAESPDKVVFGAGELGTLDYVIAARGADGTWSHAGAGGGQCVATTVPPAGHQWVGWGLRDGAKPSANDRSLHLDVQLPFSTCDDPNRPEELVGPDVVETGSDITIRIAARRLDEPDMPRQCQLLPRFVPVEVPLDGPVGSRTVINGAAWPLRPIDDRTGARDLRDGFNELRLGDGARSHTLSVERSCVGLDTATCLAAPAGVELQLRTPDGRLTTSGPGQAPDKLALSLLLLSNEPVEVVASWPGHSCPTVQVHPEDRPGLVITCTPLDRPNAVVSGTAGGWPAGEATAPGRHVVLTPADGSRPIRQLVNDDGTFSVSVPAGTWTASIKLSGAVDVTCDKAPRTVEVGGGTPIDIGLTC